MVVGDLRAPIDARSVIGSDRRAAADWGSIRGGVSVRSGAGGTPEEVRESRTNSSNASKPSVWASPTSSCRELIEVQFPGLDKGRRGEAQQRWCLGGAPTTRITASRSERRRAALDDSRCPAGHAACPSTSGDKVEASPTRSRWSPKRAITVVPRAEASHSQPRRSARRRAPTGGFCHGGRRRSARLLPTRPPRGAREQLEVQSRNAPTAGPTSEDSRSEDPPRRPRCRHRIARRRLPSPAPTPNRRLLSALSCCHDLPCGMRRGRRPRRGGADRSAPSNAVLRHQSGEENLGCFIDRTSAEESNARRSSGASA